jgi:hypothetical protein
LKLPKDALNDFSSVCQIIITRLGSSMGNGFSNTAFTTVKMALFGPMPNASASMATALKPGFRRSDRNP